MSTDLELINKWIVSSRLLKSSIRIYATTQYSEINDMTFHKRKRGFCIDQLGIDAWKDDQAFRH
jgi:hypothetical protein